MSRYLMYPPLDKKRLKSFVTLDNLTAQVPLIEIVRRRPFHVRVWVAYDHERVCGTYLAVFFSGLVKTITVYPAGNTVEHISRPADV